MLKLLFKNEIESQQSCKFFLNPKHYRLLYCYPLGQHDAISNILCLALSFLAGPWLHSLKICAEKNIWQQSECGSSSAAWWTVHAGLWYPLSQTPPYASHQAPWGRTVTNHKNPPHTHRAVSGTESYFQSIFLISKIQGLDFSSSNSSRYVIGRSRFTKKEKKTQTCFPRSPHKSFHPCSGIKTVWQKYLTDYWEEKKPNNKTQRLQLLWNVSYIIQKDWHHSQSSSGTFCSRWEAPVAETHIYQRLERPGQCRFYHCTVCIFHTYHHASVWSLPSAIKEPFLQFITNLVNSHIVKKQDSVCGRNMESNRQTKSKEKSRVAEKSNREWEQLQER